MNSRYVVLNPELIKCLSIVRGTFPDKKMASYRMGITPEEYNIILNKATDPNLYDKSTNTISSDIASKLVKIVLREIGKYIEHRLKVSQKSDGNYRAPNFSEFQEIKANIEDKLFNIQQENTEQEAMQKNPLYVGFVEEYYSRITQKILIRRHFKRKARAIIPLFSEHIFRENFDVPSLSLYKPVKSREPVSPHKPNEIAYTQNIKVGKGRKAEFLISDAGKYKIVGICDSHGTATLDGKVCPINSKTLIVCLAHKSAKKDSTKTGKELGAETTYQPNSSSLFHQIESNIRWFYKKHERNPKRNPQDYILFTALIKSKK